MPGCIERAASRIADILMREGLNSTQTKESTKKCGAIADLCGQGKVEPCYPGLKVSGGRTPKSELYVA